MFEKFTLIYVLIFPYLFRLSSSIEMDAVTITKNTEFFPSCHLSRRDVTTSSNNYKGENSPFSLHQRRYVRITLYGEYRKLAIF